MRATVILVLAILSASCSASEQPVSKQVGTEPRHPTYLASITVPLGEYERLQSFRIDTWGVRITAVCRIPPGWRIMAGGSAAPDGVIAGDSSHGVTWLKDMEPLKGLVLVRLEGAVQKTDVGAVPATFQGTAILDTGEDKDRETALSHANVQLVSADRCPPHTSME